MEEKEFMDFTPDDEVSELFGMNEYTDDMGVAVAIDAIKEAIELDNEFRLKDDVANEYAMFLVLSRGDAKASSQDPRDPRIKFAKFFFHHWVSNSPNSYAVAYRMGKEHASTEIAINNVKRAANGRRLIGATSRAKVAKAAEQFRHLSKGNAAYEMASIVNLDPGTIKRYLSELFPGDKWKE
jgi:hypothetical protein